MRATTSVVPPGAKGTTKVTGLLGHGGAAINVHENAASNAIAAFRTHRRAGIDRIMVCLLHRFFSQG